MRTITRLMLGLMLAGTALVVTATTAGATGGSETVTYTANETIPVPPPSSFTANSGGDGWAVALSSTEVFNIFHHQQNSIVTCHLQSNGSACWSPASVTITDGAGHTFANSIAPGLYLNQTNGQLFEPTTRLPDDTPGVLCIEVENPGSAPPTYCGFTALGGAGEAPLDGGLNSGLSDPVQIGTNWYMFNEVAGSGSSGSTNHILCFDLETVAPCANQPYSVNYGANTFTPFSYSWPMGPTGQDLVYQIVGSSDVLGCLDTSTETPCSGSWPVTVSSAAGAPFTMLNAQGQPIGICDPISGVPCFNLTGASVATPPGMSTAITQGIQYNGTAVVIGARVYLPNAASNTVMCYDYDLGAGCASFPLSFVPKGVDLLYTVNPDPYRPTCIWINSDSGVIANFDAYTAGVCGTGATRVLASSVVAPNPICAVSNWTSLQVVSPGPSTYTSGTVQFDDFDGNPLPTIPTQNLDSTGSLDLSNLGLAQASALPQFLITLNGESQQASSVTVKLTWTGTYSPACLSATTTAEAPNEQSYLMAGKDGGVFAYPSFQGSLPPPSDGLLVDNVVGIASTTDPGYWLVGSDGAVYAFGDAQYYGSLPGLGIVVNDIVGIVATPDGKGYWLVGSDGGVYAFGDAPYLGSLPAEMVSVHNIVGIASPDAGGYWLVGSDGGTFAFGDAAYAGSLPALGIHVGNVVGMANPDAGGYWLVGSDGAVYAFGDAPYDGSLPGLSINNATIVGIAPTNDNGGYWLASTVGGIYAFGDATYLGSMAGLYLYRPIVGIT